MNQSQLEQARKELAARFPNFATLLGYMKGRFVAVPGKKTVACDRYMRVYYDPDLAWTHDEILGALEHELGHICRRHFDRADTVARERGEMTFDQAVEAQKAGQKAKKLFDYKTWNVAGDLEINDDLVFPLPTGYGVMPSHFGYKDGGIAEGYYKKLKQKNDDDLEDTKFEEPPPGEDEDGDSVDGSTESEGENEGNQDEQDGDEGEDASSSDQGSGGGAGEEEDEDGQNGEGEGQGGEQENEDGPGSGGSGGEGGQGDQDSSEGTGSGTGQQDGEYESHAGDCGSCAGGPQRDYELPVDDDRYPGVTEEQVDRAVEEAKKASGQEMAKESKDEKLGGHGVGTAAGIIESVFGDAAHEVYDVYWEGKLHSEISRYMKTGGSGYQRPSRRLYDRKVIHIGKTRVPPTIVFLVDTSSSIAERSAKRAFAIVQKFKGWNINFKVVACDTRAKLVNPGDPFSRGGTDLGVGLRYIKEHFPSADVVMMITDAENGMWGKPGEFQWPIVVFTWSYAAPNRDKFRTVPMPPLDSEQAQVDVTGFHGAVWGDHDL